MKKSILIAALGLFSLNMTAQDTKPEEGFVFTTVKENPITSVKNQNRSSTCWSFSTLGFVESELLRLGKGEYDLSENVRSTQNDGRSWSELCTLSWRQFFFTGVEVSMM